MKNIYKIKTFTKTIITATIAVVFLFLLSPTAQAGSVPRIHTMGASSIGTDSVVLNGQTLSKESGVYTRFEWGLSRDSLISKTSEHYVGSGSSFVKFSALTSGLSSNTRYYFRAVARNNSGVSYGPVSSFYTKKVIEKNETSVNNTSDTNGAQNTETTKLVLSSSGGNTENQITEVTNGAVQLNSILVLKEIVNTTFPNGTKGINSSFSGDVIEYTLLIKNIGVVSIHNVVVKDKLSELFDLVESVPDISYLSSGNSLIWNIDLIKPSETKKILLKVKAKPVDESIVVFNNFEVEVNEYIVVSKKVTTVLNPAPVAPEANINKDDTQKGIVASVFNSVKNGLFCTEFTGLIFSMFLFVVIFFAFSLVFLFYKTQEA